MYNYNDPKLVSVMERNGSQRASSSQSEESSLLDLPDDITPESFLLKPNPVEDEAFDLTLPAIDAGYFPTEPSNRFLPGPDAKGNITQWPYRYERREPVSCENTEHLQHSEIAVPEQRGEGESTLRKSLDTFYRTLCQKKPSGGSPRYESTSQCLSLKTVDLAGKEGMKFVVKNLQIAQMVLNREENKIFPQPPCNHFCLLTPVSADANSEKGKAIPGLSDDVLQFILKQNALK
ncbi:shieldin complex subunit 1 isoform X3 [Ahaetulla prasina]|uniref:shieldin complex subunit 1 isoform X3 n=1 Tax=Ahaetulla prasina TaxID=499056 RepID=UPI002648E2D8|nr:shieldin complex subunit 1 isoform X3 [Ahaetulla prasina]